jgi:hypothetical protein
VPKRPASFRGLSTKSAGGPASSEPKGFTTQTTPPEVEGQHIYPRVTEAVAEATFNPGGMESTYYFEYGATESYGFSTVAKTVPAGGLPTTVKTTIFGLQEASEYHFRVVIDNEDGSVQGPDRAFVTKSAPGTESGCANDVIRSEQHAYLLPNCRAYELVSPPDKNGGNLDWGIQSSADGSHFGALGSASFAEPKSNFLNAPYVSERRADGWLTKNLAPYLLAGMGLNGFVMGGTFSDDVTKAVVHTQASPDEPTVRTIFVDDLLGNETWVTPPTQPSEPLRAKLLAGLSADASHIFFASQQNFGTQPLPAGFQDRQLWEWHDGEIRLASVLPDGSMPAKGATAGLGRNEILSSTTSVAVILPEPTVVSDDGSKLFFKAVYNGVQQLFVRKDGTQTATLSLSQKPGSIGEPATQPVWIGAAEDGSRALFSSTSELTADATPGGGIYQYDLDTDELHFLTPSSSGGVGLEGVSEVTEDGERVYFVSTTELVPGAGEAGGHNLYVADRSGVRFIAVLAALDGQDWNRQFGAAGNLTAQATPDGDHFAFQSARPLTGYDNDGQVEVFKWDYLDGSLTCVSCGPLGSTAEGDASILSNPIVPNTGNTFNGQLQLSRPRVFSADGSHVFFQTRDSIDPRDTNGKYDVYEWDEGRVSLISGGVGNYDSQIIDNSADGGDVFFATNDTLAPQDIDGGAGDIYDARVNGGFRPPGTESPPCEGGDCQGGANFVPRFVKPATSQLNTAGNSKAVKLRRALRACAKKKTKKVRKRCRAAAKKRYSDSSKTKGSNR